MNSKVWILGTQYDLAEPLDINALFNRIEDCQKRGAINDQTMIATALMPLAMVGAKSIVDDNTDNETG